MKTAAEIAKHVGAELHGDAAVRVTHLSSVASAREGSLVFASDDTTFNAAMDSSAAAVIAAKKFEGSAKALLLSPNPRLAFARAAELFRVARIEAVHSSAVIDPSATIGARTSIGANSFIDRDVVVGSDCRIDANVTVYAGTRIGDRVVVQAGAVLGSEGFGYVRDDATGRYTQFPQVGNLIVEDDVEIGANCTIDRGALDATIIRRGVKLDNLVHVGHNVEIGEDVVIAAQTGISGSSVIEKGAVVAGQVGIADHVRIGEGAILGAQCGVPSNKVIRGPGVLFWGTPARPIREYLKELAVLARLTKKREK